MSLSHVLWGSECSVALDVPAWNKCSHVIVIWPPTDETGWTTHTNLGFASKEEFSLQPSRHDTRMLWLTNTMHRNNHSIHNIDDGDSAVVWRQHLLVCKVNFWILLSGKPSLDYTWPLWQCTGFTCKFNIISKKIRPFSPHIINDNGLTGNHIIRHGLSWQLWGVLHCTSFQWHPRPLIQGSNFSYLASARAQISLI